MRGPSQLGVLMALLAGILLPANQAGLADGGTGGFASPNDGVSDAAVGAPLTEFETFDVRGGYVAAGIGMRNRGFGSIRIAGIPTGARIEGAYLYWTILGPGARADKGTFAGRAITGTRIGRSTGPCWPNASEPWPASSYRADVTRFVAGNGSYRLAGFESKIRSGSDAANNVEKPSAEGASLVVVYSHKDGPPTEVFLYNGNAYTLNNKLTTRITGLEIPGGRPKVKATFIGADGQSNASEPGSTVNGRALPTVDWDGTDPQTGADHSIGNLWDTDTVDISPYVREGATTVTFTTQGYPDCLIWVAQVMSIESGDTDGDAIPDSVEKKPWYKAKGGKYDHKDVWVECDYMAGLKPKARVVGKLRAAFANGPINNPDGRKGITFHLAVDDQFPFQNQWGNVKTGPGFTQTRNTLIARRNASFDGAPFTGKNARTMKRYTHYCVFINAIEPGSTSGISMDSTNAAGGIPGDMFIVSLGRWNPKGGKLRDQVGTLMHELGHNLGLKHGGNDHQNFKPNYYSVMNYYFQSGFYKERGGTATRVQIWDYSTFLGNRLREGALLEATGVIAPVAIANASHVTLFRCPAGQLRYTRFNRAVDWNCNGVRNAGTVASDINGDGARTDLGRGQDNWDNIVFDGGSIGGPGASVSSTYLDPATELDFERHHQLELEIERASSGDRPQSPLR